MEPTKQIAALIVAAGNGSRVGGDIPKQFRMVNGQPMLRRSYAAFLSHTDITKIFVVIGAGQEDRLHKALLGMPPPTIVTGGASRRESVRNGLEAIKAHGGAQYVLIHDAARPFLSQPIVSDLIAALAGNAGAVPALPVTDSMARGDGLMGATVEREGLHRIQTPQAFHFGAIYAAHMDWDEAEEASDDARMLIKFGGKIALIKGDEVLTKYTFADDFSRDDSVGFGTDLDSDIGGETRQSMPMPYYRSGTGFDVHRLVADAPLWLCGVKIDHSHGLSGHSDADVALHAITDAMLGALALGDIGDHFPPTDEQWRGASSDQFAVHALKLATATGYVLGNVDVTIICEAPKIGPHRTAMRARLAQILSTAADNISVKATTTECLGFTGRSEGIAAQAIVSFHRYGAVKDVPNE
jgi:2-C-methyl-D-erythritol 4-phosphate cytidylyltransferase / 2-C-methyl-D-erythritol 2,4-cyclodiphosphate synthase